MWEIIRYQLSHLGDFSGRDVRRTFWVYLLFLVIVQILIGIVISAPMMGNIIGSVTQGVQSGMSEAEIQAATYASLSNSLEPMAVYSMVLRLVTAALLLASFVRRLHDAGFSGWLALIPVGTLLYSQIIGYLSLDHMQAMMDEAIASGNPQFVVAISSETAASGLIRWAGVLFVLIFGIMKSQPGPNRYGEEPARP